MTNQRTKHYIKRALSLEQGKNGLFSRYVGSTHGCGHSQSNSAGRFLPWCRYSRVLAALNKRAIQTRVSALP